MRSLPVFQATLLSLLALIVAPCAFAAKLVTVGQLSQIIVSSQKETDAEVAKGLSGLQLTERLSDEKLAALEAELPGTESRQTLVILADQAVFLPLPAREIPDRPAPTIQQQEEIIGKSADYVLTALRHMPNLFARMDTTGYQYSPAGKQFQTPTTGRVTAYEPMHVVGRSTVTVLYRHGKEVIEKGGRERDRADSPGAFMTTYGEFGPIFSVIYGDLPKGKLAWGHWVQGQNGLDAVFHFEVPKRASHYLIGFCCIYGRPYRGFSAYHGELEIDPSDGTILRVTVVATVERAPLNQWGIMVKYGPVELGGRKYYCPVRSVAVFRTPMPGPIARFPAHDATMPSMYLSSGRFVPMETQVNDSVFEDYHLFRAKVQIMPDKKNFLVKPKRSRAAHGSSGSKDRP